MEKKKIFFIALGFARVALVAFFDYVTGQNLSFSIFYLLPIAFFTWYIGKNSGIVVAMLSTLIWIFMEEQARAGTFISWWNSAVRFSFYLITLLMLASLKENLTREKTLARIDFVTGIANSVSFFERAAAEISRCLRNKTPFTIVYVDCDYFKVINDAFGHAQGDKVLRLIAATIQLQVRATDMAARLAGDEFLVLLPETESEIANTIMARVQNALQRHMQENNWPITFSFGIATFLTPAGSIVEMIKKADDLMYLAKNQGRNQIRKDVFI